MLQLCIAVVVVVTLAVMSSRANRKFGRERRLPMQWSLSGAVNWTAPRPVALAVMPCLGAIILGSVAVMTLTLAPRPGQEGLEVPVMAVMGLGLVAAHALHLWLIGRTLRIGGS